MLEYELCVLKHIKIVFTMLKVVSGNKQGNQEEEHFQFNTYIVLFKTTIKKYHLLYKLQNIVLHKRR